MILPFEHLIAKYEFDSGSYDHMSKAITLVLTGLAILFAGGSLAYKAPSIGYLVLLGMGVVLAGLISLTLLSGSLRAKRAAIAVF